LQEVKEVAGASYRVNWKIYYVSLPPLISLKEASKARVAAYKKAIEDAVKATAAAEDAATAAAAAAAAEDTPAEPSELIELDSDDKNNSDDNTYATFKDINNIKAIGVEDKGDFVLD
jgi:hypothetical protein